jgi:leucine dehydrogenase
MIASTSREPLAATSSRRGTGTPLFDRLQMEGFDKLVLCSDAESGLRAVIAIHSTILGPANGGVRMLPYRDEQEAIADAMRLARGMTYKWAAAGENRGGGKAVIIGDPRRHKSRELLKSFGRFVDKLGGEYYTGEDVGMTLDDMEVIYGETNYVATLPEHVGGVGDISEATAFGAIQAMRACAERVWGSTSLSGRSVALQGLGVCGSKALVTLLAEGADVVVSDIDEEKVSAAKIRYGVTAVPPSSVHAQPVDIYAPFALGGVLSAWTIPEIKAQVVAGSANNIFATEQDATELERRGIVYAVDFIANAGGAILDAHQFYKGGFDRERAMRNVARIFDRTHAVFERADAAGVTYLEAAKQMAEERLAGAARPGPRTLQGGGD